MTMAISSIIFVALLAVAIAHFIWSVGGTWPIRNAELLAKTVVGRPGVTRMPPRIALLAVAAAALAAGVMALSLADHTAGGAWLTTTGVLLGLSFLARGVLGYTEGWRARFPEEPFATLDRRNYSPLSLILGAGFLILVVMRLA